MATMSEVEEPQFKSLSERIAALNSQEVGVGHTNNQIKSSGKRAPPPPPPNRPALPTRPQTTNNPPILAYGSSVTKQSNNQPIGVKNLLPPPPVDRDNPNYNNVRSPPLPARNGPPPLPTRKASSPAPTLPARKQSTQLTRRDSNSSLASYSSTISGLSLGHGGSSITSGSSVEGRKLPPTLDQAKLPPLPPTRREREQKEAEEEQAKAPRMALVSMKSESNLRALSVVDRDMAPRMPPRPRMPERPVGKNEEVERPPAQPPRRLPPPNLGKSILSMGFNNPKTETNNQAQHPDPVLSSRPMQSQHPPMPAPRPVSRPAPKPAVIQELDTNTFDRVTLGGTAVLVKVYSPICMNCEIFEPKWKELADSFSFASERLTFATFNGKDGIRFLSKFGYSYWAWPTLLFFDGRSKKPVLFEGEKELENVMRFLEENSGILLADADKMSSGNPPPIPLSSKPSFAQVQAAQSQPQSRPRPSPALAPPSGCLLCRDFSGPDQVAAQYPRQSLPRSGDMTAYLADVLCGPFSSATDKARAIFTWQHHNIAYDVDAFFGNRATVILLSNPASLPPPANPSGHAWNAVRIDDGEWKLIDACWGAGNVENQTYTKKFKPSFFTMPNDQFGLKHFPQDDAFFFRSDGSIPTWDDYYTGPVGSEPVQIFGSIDEHGLSETSFSPPQKAIPITNEVIRFQFSRVCQHWDFEKNGGGKPYCLILKIGGLDGRKDDFVAFENNEFWYWADVKARDLGCRGGKVSCYAVTTVNGKDARGMTRSEYLSKKGKCAMSFAGISEWALI
ncbi:hypothetical protein B7494_g144 [Chlorociboria aeruginascens]|nr:hypothetical protein B7494_g144 [Chlorociboria aeruginascens]